MNTQSRIFIAGHNGLLGSAIVRRLKSLGYNNLITVDRKEINLTNQNGVNFLFDTYRPEYVFLVAAKVGGIVANRDNCADFIKENLLIETNVISAASKFEVEKLLFTGSACAYPKFASNPIQEESLLTGELEPTNRAYAIAKIAGIEMCQAYAKQYGRDFISVMPTNLYGPGDHYDLTSSHVLPGMLRRIHDAKIAGKKLVKLWGSGRPSREFLYIDDCADACVFLMNYYDSPNLINLGSGEVWVLRDLARLIAGRCRFEGEIQWDESFPDGTPDRWLDSTKLFGLGWTPQTFLREGIVKTYEDFVRQYE